MDDYTRKLIDDLPQQYKGREKIESLMTVIGRQMQELYDFYAQLGIGRGISNSEGEQLDRIGSILCLTRTEALYIVRKSGYTEMTDELYRKVLKYKAALNTSTCTYDEIMDSIAFLWNTKDLSYSEPEDRPATVVLSLPRVGFDDENPAEGRIPSVKPAGVLVIYLARYAEKIWLSQYLSAKLPMVRMEWSLQFFVTWIKRLKLNGSWLLDGSEKFDGDYIMVGTGVPMTVKYILPISKSIEMFYLPLIRVKAMSRTPYGRFDHRGRYRAIIEDHSGFITSEGQSVSTKVRMASQIAYNDETISSMVTIRKNIWYLNGNFNLDGGRCLNAIERKEAL